MAELWPPDERIQAFAREFVVALPSSRSPGSFVPIVDTRPIDHPWPELSWPPPEDLELNGHFVTVRPARSEADAAELFSVIDDDRVWVHLADRPTSVESLSNALVQQRANGRFPFVVRAKRPIGGFAPGEIVGMSSYLEVSVRDARLEVGTTAYAPAVWGSAVNPETKLLLLGYAFDVLGAGRVQIKTDVRNTRSQLAIARLGATYEGTLARYQHRSDGTVRDTVLFAITAEGWPTVRERLQRRLAPSE